MVLNVNAILLPFLLFLGIVQDTTIPQLVKFLDLMLQKRNDETDLFYNELKYVDMPDHVYKAGERVHKKMIEIYPVILKIKIYLEKILATEDNSTELLQLIYFHLNKQIGIMEKLTKEIKEARDAYDSFNIL